jgi:hypothetical protein
MESRHVFRNRAAEFRLINELKAKVRDTEQLKCTYPSAI